MKVVSVVGARPQFIKAAVVSRALRSLDGVTEVLVHTGQHYDDNMSKVFFQELDIPEPDANLGIAASSHGAQTGRMLEAIETVLLAEQPDWVLVYGDTNSTLAGALAAAKRGVPVAHVEAGLRSNNRAMPEEINRIVADRVSSLLFAPTDTARENLLSEGCSDDSIKLAGDVMYDAALYYAETAESRSSICGNLGVSSKAYVLATIHRAENTDDANRLRDVFNGLQAVAREITTVVPLHPRTRKALKGIGIAPESLAPLQIVDPVGYLDMVMLEKNARAIVTDSGGVQREAYFFDVPSVVVRSETEWVELVSSGFSRLTDPITAQSLCDTVTAALQTPLPVERSDIFGDGRAAQAIAQALLASR